MLATPQFPSRLVAAQFTRGTAPFAVPKDGRSSTQSPELIASIRASGTTGIPDMAHYRIYFDDADHVREARELECADDGEARTTATRCVGATLKRARR